MICLGRVLEVELIALGIRGEGEREIAGLVLRFLACTIIGMMVSHIGMRKIGRESFKLN